MVCCGSRILYGWSGRAVLCVDKMEYAIEHYKMSKQLDYRVSKPWSCSRRRSRPRAANCSERASFSSRSSAAARSALLNAASPTGSGLTGIGFKRIGSTGSGSAAAIGFGAMGTAGIGSGASAACDITVQSYDNRVRGILLRSICAYALLDSIPMVPSIIQYY